MRGPTAEGSAEGSEGRIFFTRAPPPPPPRPHPSSLSPRPVACARSLVGWVGGWAYLVDRAKLPAAEECPDGVIAFDAGRRDAWFWGTPLSAC